MCGCLRHFGAGTGKAKMRIRGGRVVDVRILSGPKAFYSVVRAAVLKYECIASGAAEVSARHTFEFKLERRRTHATDAQA